MSGASARAASLLETVTRWITRIALLNVTWLLQVLAGGVVLGLAPATQVLYRQLAAHLGEDGEPTGLRASWRAWRRAFRPAQRDLLVPLLTVVVLGFYLRVVAGSWPSLGVAIVTAVYLCWLLHLPAVEVPGARAGTRWLAALRLFSGAVGPFALTFLAAVATVAGLTLYLPAAVLFAVPALPALLATLTVRRVRGA
jgi:uncharacterized membrane protein YesL